MIGDTVGQNVHRIVGNGLCARVGSVDSDGAVEGLGAVGISVGVILGSNVDVGFDVTDGDSVIVVTDGSCDNDGSVETICVGDTVGRLDNVG